MAIPGTNGGLWRIILPTFLIAALGWMSWITVRVMVIESNRFTSIDGRALEARIDVVRAELSGLQRLPVQPWLLDRMDKLERQVVSLQSELRHTRTGGTP